MRKSLKYLALSAAALLAMTSCKSNDDEPAVLRSITVESVTPLTEDGMMTATIKTDPDGARLTLATVNSNAFLTQRLASKGDGRWEVDIKVTDFLNCRNGQTVRLTVQQSDGIQAVADITVNDPYSIEGKYTMVSPLTYSLTDVESGKAIGLPMIITGQEPAELAKISKFLFTDKVIDGSTVSVNGWKSSWFVLQPIDGECGAYLVAKQEAIDKMATQKVPQNLGTFCLALIGEYGRVQICSLDNVYACPSQTSVTDDALQATVAELKDPAFKKDGVIDGTKAANRLGLHYMGSATEDISKSMLQTDELGVFAADGKKVENDDFFIAGTNTDFLKDCKLDYQFYGNADVTVTPGSYTYRMLYRLDWTHAGVAYPRINARLSYDLTIK